MNHLTVGRCVLDDLPWVQERASGAGTHMLGPLPTCLDRFELGTNRLNTVFCIAFITSSDKLYIV